MNLYSHFKDSLLNQQNVILTTQNSNYTFASLDNSAARLARVLAACGMRPGDRLAALIEKSAYNLLLYLACLRSGIVYLPLNSHYTENELDYFFNDADPKMIVCDPKNEQKICNINGACKKLIKTLDQNGYGSLTQDIDKSKEETSEIYSSTGDATAVMLYTSGTTGKPKGAMITHQGLLCNTQDLNQIWSITERDTILHMLPLFHVHGLFFALNTALLSGAKLILLPKFEPDQFFKYLPQATLFMGVPTYYTRLLKDKRLSKESCQHMRLFISGSAPLLPATFNDFQNKTGHTLLERYGMTETGVNTSNPSRGLRKVGTVGSALPSVTVRVMGDNNQATAINQVGHIQVQGNNLFNGYWRKPEQTKSVFTDDGFFITGDLGTLDTDGYLSIVGRATDMIITGGLNVYPKEIELTIDSIDAIVESAIVGIPHPDFGEAVIAIIVADQKRINEQNIIALIKQQHAHYKCPKKIFFIDVLPKNVMGKIQKDILRKQFANTFT